MLTSTPAGFTPDASPAASLILNADAAAFAALAPDIRKRASKWSVAPTKSYYGFNVRPRQVRSVACIRDAERIAAHLASASPDADRRAVAFGYLCRLNAALAAAVERFAAVEADEARARDAWSKATDRLTREALLREMKRHQGARWASANERREDIERARDILAAALVATAQEGGAL